MRTYIYTSSISLDTCADVYLHVKYISGYVADVYLHIKYISGYAADVYLHIKYISGYVADVYLYVKYISEYVADVYFWVADVFGGNKKAPYFAVQGFWDIKQNQKLLLTNAEVIQSISHRSVWIAAQVFETNVYSLASISG